MRESSFLTKRLMSFLGVLPVGAFLIQHFFSSSYIFISDKAFNEHSEFLTSFPVVWLIEILLIYLPILVHAALGIVIIYKGQNNFASYGFFRNWMFFFQRLSGFIALIFIAVHSYTTRVSHFLAGKEFAAADMRQALSDPFWFWFYFVGVLFVVFHFANGLWSFLITWGITIGPRAQRVSSALTMGLFVIMGLWGVRILLQFVQ